MALIINGENIDDEIIEAEFRQIKGQYERMLQVACCERDPEFQGYAKDNIIARAVLNQEAAKRFPEVDEEDVTIRLDKLIEEAGGKEHFYMKIGMPMDATDIVRANVANGVRLDKLLGTVYGEYATPDDAGVEAYYSAHLDAFKSEEQIHVVHITKGLEGAKSRGEVYEKMRGLRRELMAGADFAKMAEEQRGNEQQQIDLGWFKRGEFMEEFEAIAFSMDKEELSPVFTTQLGFHLCKVIDRRDPAPLPLADIKDAVLNRMLEEDRDRKFNTFVDGLKTAATIEDTEPSGEGCGCH
ncbi:MAG: Peptidylprolyl isomerase [Verrucomicrobiaceae bacterium]|nr:Peptidylprolyl isomerase [Verrucomicrobiaceae bacterium]